MEKSINFSLQPNSRGIEAAGNRSSSFFRLHGLPDETVQAQVMILRELIKNGAKYAKFTPSENEIRVGIHIDDHTVSIEVMNPVDESCRTRLEKLDRAIQFIRGYQDPFEAYMVMKKMSPKQTPHGEAVGLSLAEIAYEGNATIDFFISEDNILNLTAVKRLA
jgi:hypothetical protein